MKHLGTSYGTDEKILPRTRGKRKPRGLAVCLT